MGANAIKGFALLADNQKEIDGVYFMEVTPALGLMYSVPTTVAGATGESAVGLAARHPANTAQIISPTAVSPPAVPSQAVPSPSAPSSIPSSSTPSSIVTLGRTFEPPQTYVEPVIVHLLRDKSPVGPAATATSQALMQSFNQLSDKKIIFTPSNLLSKVGALSRETTEYRNEVRKFYVPYNTAVEKFEPDFSKISGTREESVFLTIKTKEGDSIQIQFSRNTSGRETAQLEFSFTVDGELSEQEQNALEKLAAKLGEMGDEFFRTDTAELRGLKDIDTDTIHYFKLTLQRPDPENDTYVEHTYEFTVDEVAQTQHLVAEDVRGYEVDIKTQLQTLAIENTLERELLQQYIDLIRRSADESDTPNASKRFMMDAFESLFSEFIAVGPTQKEQDPDIGKAESALAAFDSGLPDFKATFRSPVLHNPGFYVQAAAMVLTLEQETRTEQNGDNLLVKQETRYELSNSHFEFSPKAYLDDLGGNYTYTTEHEEGSTSRVLSMTNDRVNNIWIEQDASREKQTSQFVNYTLADQEEYSYSDRRVQEFAELLEKLQGNNQRTAVEELLHSSKDRLFLGIV